MSKRTRISAIGATGLAVALLCGVAAGIGGFTFVYARGGSYLSNDPAACANCHVMQGHFDAWTRSSHHAVAGCNDCHTPDDVVGKYVAKASNGFFHSLHFTTGEFPEPLRIKPHNRAITEARCRGCHAAIVAQIDANHREGHALACVRCHANVGHLR